MKKTFFLAGIASFLLSLSINAQQDSTKPMQQDTTKVAQQVDTTKPAQQVTAQPSTETQQQSATQMQQSATVEQKKYGNPTVDSILSKYTLVPMPNPITTEQIFPVIGQYQSTTNADQKITVTLDDQNKGFAWVDGLPQGKVKAVLRKSPATYKIPVQKTEGGTDVPEGTLIYDKDTKTLSVIIGKAYNDQDPAAAFAPAVEEPVAAAPAPKAKKGKKAKAAKPVKVEKPWVFTGTKVEHTTASVN